MALPLAAQAQSSDVARENDKPPPESPKKKGSLIESTHAAITETILKTADRVDAFFGEERIEEESRKSELRLSLSVQAEQDKNLKISGRGKFKLVLPNLQDRFQIVISREQEAEREVDDLLEVQSPAIVEEAETIDWSSSLRWMLNTTKDLNINFDAGIKFRYPPVPFTRARFRRSLEFNQWAIRFTQKAGVFQDVGWEESTRLDFERPVKTVYFFRFSTTGSWFEEQHGYFVDQRITLSQKISRNRLLLYEWNTPMRTGKSGEDSPEELTARYRVLETYVGVRYRQTLFWQWLFAEISPGMAFPREREYKATARVRFKIEIQFMDLPYN